jgi:hypothetical protein
MARLVWNTVVVCPEEGASSLEGDARLVALLLWLRGEAPPSLVFLDGAGAQLTDPMAIDWRNFPLQDAIDVAKGAPR